MSEPDFDPDAYLRDLRARKAAEAPFDPDAYLLDLKERKASQAQFGSSAVGSVRPGETPEAAAKRLGGHFVSADQSSAALDEVNRNVMREGMAKPIMSAAQGALSNFGDELAAATETAHGIARHPIDTFGKWGPAYEQNHADWQRMFDESTRDRPGAYLGGALMTPNPIGKAGLLARLAAMGGQGAMAGLGGSKASLVNGEFGEAAKDTGIGGAIGLAAGAGAELIGAPVRWLAGKLGNEANAAADVARAEIAAKREAELASAKASERSLVGGGNRQLETGEQVVNNTLGNIDPAAQRKMILALTTPEAAALRTKIAENTADYIPEQAGRIRAAEAKAAQAAQAAMPAAVDAATNQTLANAPSNLLRNFMRSVGQRAVMSGLGAMAGGATGMVLGDDWKTGTGIGAGFGWATPGVLQFIRNSAKNPAFQHLAATGMQGLLGHGVDAVDNTARLAAQSSTDDSPVQSPFLRWMEDEATPEEEARALAAALRQRKP